MYGDITFVKMKIRLAVKTRNCAVIQIHAMHFILATRQKALGQCIADKSIDAENQHPRLAYRRVATIPMPELHTLDQVHVLCKLNSRRIDTAINLRETYFQHAFPAGDK